MPEFKADEVIPLDRVSAKLQEYSEAILLPEFEKYALDPVDEYRRFADDGHLGFIEGKRVPVVKVIFIPDREAGQVKPPTAWYDAASGIQAHFDENGPVKLYRAWRSEQDRIARETEAERQRLENEKALQLELEAVNRSCDLMWRRDHMLRVLMRASDTDPVFLMLAKLHIEEQRNLSPDGMPKQYRVALDLSPFDKKE